MTQNVRHLQRVHLVRDSQRRLRQSGAELRHDDVMVGTEHVGQRCVEVVAGEGDTGSRDTLRHASRHEGLDEQ